MSIKILLLKSTPRSFVQHFSAPFSTRIKRTESPLQLSNVAFKSIIFEQSNRICLEEKRIEGSIDEFDNFSLLLLQDSIKLVSDKEHSMPDNNYVLQFDGGSRGNSSSSPAGAGAVIFSSKNGVRKAILETSVYLQGTNNEAEYSALIYGLEMALSTLHLTEICIEGDSQLVIRQVEGSYRVRKPHLLPLCNKAKDLLSKFERFTINHIPRAENSYADKLANLAMDEKKTRPPSPLKAIDNQNELSKVNVLKRKECLNEKSICIKEDDAFASSMTPTPTMRQFKNLSENEINLFKDLRVVYEEGDNHSLLLSFPYNIECSNLIKKHIFGMKWNKVTKKWSCPQQSIQDLILFFDQVRLPLPDAVREMKNALPPLIKKKESTMESTNPCRFDAKQWKKKKSS